MQRLRGVRARTGMSTNSNAIGVVGLPSLQRALAAEGFTTVTGEDFRQAATFVRSHLQTQGDMPVIVFDDGNFPAQAATCWLRAIVARTSVVVISGQGAAGLSAEGVRAELTAPTTLGDVLLAVLDDHFPTDAAFATQITLTGPRDTTQAPVAEPTSEPAPCTVSPARPAAPAPASQPAPVDPWTNPNLNAGLAVNTPPAPAQVDPVPADSVPAPAPVAATQPEITGPTPPPTLAAKPSPARGGLDEVDPDDLDDFDFDEELSPPDAAPTSRVVAEPSPAVEPTPVPAPVAPALLPSPDQPGAMSQQPIGEPADRPRFGSQSTPPPTPAAPLVASPAPLAAREPSGLEDLLVPSNAHSSPGNGRLADVVVVFGAKGGVGKSTSSLFLGQLAGAHGPEGFRVAVVDANAGQSDLRVFLRLQRSPLPTIYHAALSGQAEQALAGPSVVNSHRDQRLGEVNFGLVSGPPRDLPEHEALKVTPELYARAIAHARTKADLVIVDTQIVEHPDKSGLWDTVFFPLINTGAWLVAVSDTSSASVHNIDATLRMLSGRQITRDRVFLLFNRVPEPFLDQTDAITTKLAPLARHVGTVPVIAAVDAQMKSGRLPYDDPLFAPALATVLHGVTGHPQYEPHRFVPVEDEGGLLGRLRRRMGGK